MTTPDTELSRAPARHAGDRGSETPCVRQITHGPESAGDDAALIQRKASFDTGRADRALVARGGTGPGLLIPTEPVRARPPAHTRRIRSSTAERHVHTVEVGGSAPPGCTWAHTAHMVDGAGWRG